MLLLLLFGLQIKSVSSAVNASIHNLRCSNKHQTWQDAMTECISGGGRPVSFMELNHLKGKTAIADKNVWTSNYFSSFSGHSSANTEFLELCGFRFINCDGHASEKLYSFCTHIRLNLCRDRTTATFNSINQDVHIFNGTWKDCEDISLNAIQDFACPAYYWIRDKWPGKTLEIIGNTLPNSSKLFICGSSGLDIGYFFRNCSARQKALCFIDECNNNFGRSCFNDNQSNGGSHTCTTEVQNVTERAGSLLEQKDKLGTAALVGIIVTVCIVLASIVVLVVFMRRRYGCIIKTSNKQSNADTSTYQTMVQRPHSLDGHSNAAYELTSDQLNLNVKTESAVYIKVKTDERIQDKLTANNDPISSDYEFAVATTIDSYSSSSVVESDNTFIKTQDPMNTHDDYNTTLLVRKVNEHTDSPYDKMSSGDHQANNEYDTTFKTNKLLFENDLYNKLSGTPASSTKPNTEELTQEDLDENYDFVSRPTGKKCTTDNIYNTLQ